MVRILEEKNKVFSCARRKVKNEQFWGKLKLPEKVHFWTPFLNFNLILSVSENCVRMFFSGQQEGQGGMMDFRSMAFSKENPECFEVRFMSELFSQKHVKS